MQFSSALIAAMALAMANAVQFTNSAFNGITAGQPITLTWTDASGPVTITLKNGASTDLKTVSTVASGQTTGSYTWNVPSTLTQDTYALEISDSTGAPNYSPQFQLIGGAPASVSASASSAISSVASSVSSILSSQSSALSSALSQATSAVASITSNATTSSSAASSTGAASNATTTSGSSSAGSSTTKGSSTGTKTSASSTGSSTTVPNANSAVQIASPLALVFLTFAAIFSLN